MNKRYGMAALLLVPMLGQAEPSLELDYGTFYSQMKTFAKGEFGHARLGFYLASQQNGRRCGLTSARVSTPDRDVPAEVTVDGSACPSMGTSRSAAIPYRLFICHPFASCSGRVDTG